MLLFNYNKLFWNISECEVVQNQIKKYGESNAFNNFS